MATFAKPIRARYVGYSRNTENHGDETLLWIIKDLLEPEIIVTDDEVDYDVALLGGGTLINQSPWLIDHFAKMLDGARTGRGLVVGSGVGDLAFWGDTFARWRPLLERCDLIGVRGPHSAALLSQHGIDRARCIGDPYLWLQAPVCRPAVPKRLGVNLGGTNDSLWGSNDQDLLNFIIAVCLALKARGWSFAWVSVWSKDQPLLESVRQKVDAGSAPVIDARSQTLAAYSAIGGCELFLGEKLHANAMAAVAGVPFISLEYQPKVRDFAASLGMEDWVISTAERDVQAVLMAVDRLMEQRETVQKAMLAARHGLRRQLEDFTAQIKATYQIPARGSK